MALEFTAVGNLTGHSPPPLLPSTPSPGMGCKVLQLACLQNALPIQPTGWASYPQHSGHGAQRAGWVGRLVDRWMNGWVGSWCCCNAGSRKLEDIALNHSFMGTSTCRLRSNPPKKHVLLGERKAESRIALVLPAPRLFNTTASQLT